MTRSRPYRRHCRGISLVELMIGLTLSLFILGALAQAFAVATDTRREQEAINRLMDGGRAASEIVGRALRMAAYFGCTGVDAKDLTIHQDSGAAAGATSDYKNGIATRGLYGIDATQGASAELITWQAMDNVATTLAAGITLAPPEGFTDPTIRSAIQVASTAGLAAGDWVSINNCQTADVLKIAGTTGGLTFGSTCLSCARSYPAGALLQKIQRNRFYIATGARGRPSLFLERDGVQPGTELVEGVERMAITYGVDANLDGIVDLAGSSPGYLTAAQVSATCDTSTTKFDPTCWDKVKAVRLSLLMVTVEDGVTNQAQTFSFNGGASETATDRRLRREFSAVISVRNARI